jgi:polyhydroxybutyrate depolymerase
MVKHAFVRESGLGTSLEEPPKVASALTARSSGLGLGMNRFHEIVACSAMALLLASCSTAKKEAEPTVPKFACANQTFGFDRPVDVYVPESYDCANPAPLVVMLHGYTSSGPTKEAYFNLKAESDKRGFLYLFPTGTKDGFGNNFWNATDACCNFSGSTIDDSGYLSKLIVDVQAEYNVDAKRVFFVGHSNGGFMSYRMACEHSNQVAAIASLAGATYADMPTKCANPSPVTVLQIHGTSDEVISYMGGRLPVGQYPSAEASGASWAIVNSCKGGPKDGPAKLDLDASVAGSESTVKSWEGCVDGTAVSLWSVADGKHTLTITPSLVPQILDFFYAHPKL